MKTNELNNQKELSEVFSKYNKGKKEYLIPIMQDVQDRLQYLSSESVDSIAEFTGVPPAKVYGVATFYNQFKFNAPGKYKIAVCRGTACHVIGSLTVLEKLESELGIKAGSTTPDGLFSIEEVACLGACSMAPVIMVNQEFHGRVTSKSIEKLIKTLKA